MWWCLGDSGVCGAGKCYKHRGVMVLLADRKFPGCSMQQELDRKLLPAGRLDRYGAFVRARGAVTRTAVGDTLGMGLETPDRWCLSP